MKLFRTGRQTATGTGSATRGRRGSGSGSGAPVVLVDRSVPLPAGAAETLRSDNPRLLELRAAYDALDWPVVAHSRWRPEQFEHWLDLAWFRGENAYIWHYRDDEQVTRLRYFAWLTHLESIDEPGLLARLEEDGAFGCWTQEFAGHPRCSRDLLDAVAELLFLDRHLGLLGSEGYRVLDIGAGYGRLAHRASVAAPALADWCCVDAVAPSTFLSEWYLDFRGVVPPARVVALPDVPAITDRFDLAVNVHSFSECTLEAIGWWLAQLERLAVPALFVVPNEAEGFLSLEADGSRRDFLGAMEAVGYELVVDEPALSDPALRELLEVHDRHCLFRRR